MGKPKLTPKLDGTVKVADQVKMPIPEYSRPYQELQSKAGKGMRIRIEKRVLNEAHSAFETYEVEGTITDLNGNMVMINTGTGFKSTPWWAIHNWEILGEVEI